MKALKHLTVLGFFVTATSVYSACSPRPGAGARPESPEGGSVVDDGTGIAEAGPQVWIHGMGGAPDKAAEIHAQGVREIVDLRTAKPKDLNAFFARYAKNNMGLCLTLRWADAEGPEGTARTERPPTPAESRRVLDGLIKSLNSAPAKELTGRLWIQFYNEFLGGPGTFEASDDDELFSWAAEAAARIRAEAPHVRLCGPAMIATDVLDESESTLTSKQTERRQRMLRGIAWSVEHTDAVDVHLHTDSGASARSRLQTVRRAMNTFPDGEKCGIVVWEWSASRATDHNPQAARQATIDIYNAMAEYNVIAAAYSQYHVPKRIADRFGWVTLTDESGEPREPFYSLFLELADKSNGNKAPAVNENPPASDNNRRIRRRRNRRVVDPVGSLTDPSAAESPQRSQTRLLKSKKRKGN